MGIDIYYFKYCNRCKRSETLYSDSITYNLAPMWYKIYPNDKFMFDFTGLTNSKIHKKLIAAKETILDDKPEFEKLNAPNGFGTVDSLLRIITKMIEVMTENKDGKWGFAR